MTEAQNVYNLQEVKDKMTAYILRPDGSHWSKISLIINRNILPSYEVKIDILMLRKFRF